MATKYDVAITGGKVYDGSGAKPTKADIGIKGDRIAFIGEIKPSEAGQTVSAFDKAVAPGFIDIHTHSDRTALVHPESFGRITQGVTTELGGNCGSSPFPMPEDGKLHSFDSYEVDVDWKDARGFLTRMGKTGSGINRGIFVGHGSIRAAVIGREDVQPTEAQLDRMCEEVSLAVEDGCFGLSSGLIYPTGCYSKTEELIAMAAAAKTGGGIYVSHIRGEGSSLESAIEEILRIGREAEVHVNISHMKVHDKPNWGKIDWLIERLQKEKEAGTSFTADRYPYVASSTLLSSILPNWAHDGGRSELLKRLESVAQKAKIREEILASHDWEGYWSSVKVSEVYNDELAEYEGMSLEEVAEEMNEEPVDALFHILQRDECASSGVFFGMRESNLERILELPFVAIGSDGANRAFEGITAEGKPHPRSFGTFTRVLRRYVREKGTLTLEEAIRRMTSLPASIVGIKDRGILQKDKAADIVIFDPKKVADKSTFEQPAQPSEGIAHVLVNGQFVLRDGKTTGGMPGKVLRRGQS